MSEVNFFSGSGKNEDHTGVKINFLRSLFCQSYVTLNGFTVTQASELYHYLSFLETLMSYGTDAAAKHLSNAYWYLDTGDMQPNVPTAEYLIATTNRDFINRWKRLSASGEYRLFVRLHSDVYNVPYTCCPMSSYRLV